MPQLEPKSKYSINGLSTKLLKKIWFAIAPALAFFFNETIQKGEFPDVLKIARVLPIFKSGNKKDPRNCRPVSILPALSKVFEKVVDLTLRAHLEPLLSKSQHGFRDERSTVTALSDLVGYVEN